MPYQDFAYNLFGLFYGLYKVSKGKEKGGDGDGTAHNQLQCGVAL